MKLFYTIVMGLLGATAIFGSTLPETDVVSSGTLETEVSQKQFESDFKVGILFGGGLSTMTFSKKNANVSERSGNHLGIAAGIGTEIGFSPLLALRPELLYIQKGAEYEAQDGYKLSVAYDVLELPILLAIRTKGDPFRLNFFFGPSVSMAVKRSAQNETQKIDLKNEINTYNISLQAGMEAELLISSHISLFLNGRFISSLLNVTKEKTITTSAGSSIITTGLKFAL